MSVHIVARRARARLKARPRVSAYAGVAAAWAASLALAMLLRPFAHDAAAFVFFPIVCAAAALAGGGPGVFAAALGATSVFALSESSPGLGALVFACVGVAIAAGGDWIHRRQAQGLQSAQALSAREAHLRSIYDTALDALIVIDERGALQSFSAAAERMFGWSASEVLGRNVTMLMPAPDRHQHDAYLFNYMKSGVRRIIGIGRVVVGERKGGATFPMELAVGEVRSEHGRVFTGFVRDLSERQATETRLQELQAELVHMSRVTAMGEMASSLAHELNQPLSAIANYMSGGRRLLERGEPGPRAIEALDKAAEQALRAGEIIRRLRDFLERGEGVRSVEPLQKLVMEACALALVGAKESGVSARYRFDPAIRSVIVDRVQIQQVIVNLVRNALDAMEHAPRRDLQVATAAADDRMALISVSDTGHGLDEAVAAKLFEPFVTNKPNGMGVGLSISRSIVESHGGRIWCEKHAGGGAVFCFTVPTHDPEGPSDER